MMLTSLLNITTFPATFLAKMPDRINVTDCRTPLRIPVRPHEFDLAATLECGQAFRWQRQPDGWFTGIVDGCARRVRQVGDTVEGDVDPHYFALDVSLPKILATFPNDPALSMAVEAHRGLRVLRQEPWETLASFIASSTKQIVQIRQIVAALADRFGVKGAFPTPDVIARASLPQLAACKLGFRAKYLLAAARAVDSGVLRLDALPAMDYDRALEELMKLPGVGEKIANCTLLFSCGHNEAFPVDVHLQRSLQRLFPGRKMTAKEIRAHFGPYAGWAQQYLFFSQRTRGREVLLDRGAQ
jgi:N-glycosylase/DNA lyase